MTVSESVRSKADDPDESRRSWGRNQTIFWAKADDLLSQSRRSDESRRSLKMKNWLKADDPAESRRSFSHWFFWIKADDPGSKQTIFFCCLKGWKQTILGQSRRSFSIVLMDESRRSWVKADDLFLLFWWMKADDPRSKLAIFFKAF